MDQISGTTQSQATAQQGQDDSQPADGSSAEQPGFGSRGRARRRARFLRKARELAYRDLGGLVFNLHQFGQRNDALVLGKLATLGHIDTELRTIETALQERRPITVLREAGITACPRCAAIHGSEDRFCPNCGLPMARNVDLPVAGAPAGAPVVAPPAPVTRSYPMPSAPPPPVNTPSIAPTTGSFQPVAAPAAPSASPPTATAPAPPATPPSTPPTPPPPAPSSTPPAAPPAPPSAPAPSPPAAPGAASDEADSSSGRSPNPPASGGRSEADMASAAPEDSTEIIHPQAPGS